MGGMVRKRGRERRKRRKGIEREGGRKEREREGEYQFPFYSLTHC